MAARLQQHADEDPGVRSGLRSEPDLELHVLSGRSGPWRSARASRSPLRHWRARLSKTPDSMGHAPRAEHCRRPVPE